MALVWHDLIPALHSAKHVISDIPRAIHSGTQKIVACFSTALSFFS
jgi:hypothetical protein